MHNNKRKLEKSIRSIIKDRNKDFNREILQNMFNDLSLSELKQFWNDFSCNISIARSWGAVPHWQTSERNRIYQIEVENLRNYPLSINAEGERKIEKKELESYIIEKIKELTIIENEKYIEYKNSSIISKLLRFLYLLSIILLPFMIISMILVEVKRFAHYASLFLIVFSVIYGMTFIFEILKSILKK